MSFALNRTYLKRHKSKSEPRDRTYVSVLKESPYDSRTVDPLVIARTLQAAGESVINHGELADTQATASKFESRPFLHRLANGFFFFFFFSLTIGQIEDCDGGRASGERDLFRTRETRLRL